MRAAVLILLLGVVAGCASSGDRGDVAAAGAAPSRPDADSTPAEVVVTCFEHLRAGRTDAAALCFHAANAEQGAAVAAFVAHAVTFLAERDVEVVVEETFVADGLAACATRPRRQADGERIELEPLDLARYGGVWRLLPDPNRAQAPINNLGPAQMETLAGLRHAYGEFKTAWERDHG